MAGVEIIWNAVSSTTIPELVFSNPVRQMLGDHRGSFQEVPGRRGSWYFPEVRGRRLITVPGFIQVDSFPTARRDAVLAVADWLDVDIEARLVLGDDPGFYYEAVLGDCGDVTEWRDVGEFEFQWHASPFAYELEGSEVELSATNNYNTAFDPDIFTPLNAVIEVTPTNGTLTDFDLGMNGESLSWQGNLLSGSTLTINGISTVVTLGSNTDTELTGAYDVNDLDMAGVMGRFPSLIPGVNTFNFHVNTGTATAITVVIHYRKAYRR
jgi:phage-related protein